ncbi:MAG: DUF4388 domain-containing protein, partial [Acidobacteriota bacterium]
MGVTGNLKTMTPGDLLQWLSLGQKTGTLLVSSDTVQKRVFFRNGRVISSASNDPREYLGQFLMSRGYISEPELKKAMEVQLQSKILLGKILVMIEVISEKDLVRLMRLKAEEEIYDLFLWNDGKFEFIDDELPTMEMIPLQVDVTGIIMEGTRRADEWMRIREIIADETMIPVIDVPVEPGADEELDDVSRTIVHAIDGRRSIADLVLETRSSAFVVSSTLYNMIADGYVHLVSPSAEKAEKVHEQLAPPKVTAVVSPVVLTEDDEITSMLTRAQQALRAKDYEKTQRLLRAAQNLDPNNGKVRSAMKGAEA